MALLESLWAKSWDTLANMTRVPIILFAKYEEKLTVLLTHTTCERRCGDRVAVFRDNLPLVSLLFRHCEDEKILHFRYMWPPFCVVKTNQKLCAKDNEG